MPQEVYDGGGHFYASEVHEAERPEESKLLGPNGRPLRYRPRQPVGFDLRGKKQDAREQ